MLPSRRPPTPEFSRRSAAVALSPLLAAPGTSRAFGSYLLVRVVGGPNGVGAAPRSRRWTHWSNWASSGCLSCSAFRTHTPCPRSPSTRGWTPTCSAPLAAACCAAPASSTGATPFPWSTGGAAGGERLALGLARAQRSLAEQLSQSFFLAQAPTAMTWPHCVNQSWKGK